MTETGEAHRTWETMVSLSGIVQAIDGLGYRSRRSLKYRLVDTLRAFHEQEGETVCVRGLDSDDVIRTLWNTGKGAVETASKRRNLSSLRSSVNADLMALYRKGGNPEGVIISPENTFVPCEEAKNQTLETLKSLSGDGEGGLDPKRIHELLKGVQELIAGTGETQSGELKVEAAALSELQGVVRGLARDLGVEIVEEGKEDAASPGGKGDAPGAVLSDGAAGTEEAEVEALEGEEEAIDEACEEVEVLEEEAEEALEEDAGLEEAEVEALEGEEEDDDDQDPAGTGSVEGENGDEGVLDGWDFLEDEPPGAREDPERRRILSEEFNAALAAMDRFFNAYILVPQGTYPFGKEAPATGDDADLLARLQAFYIGRFPVTNALFEVFVEKTGYTTTAEKEGYGTVYQGRYRRAKDVSTGKQTLYCSSGIVSSRIRGACWYQPTGPGSTLRGRRNHPVVQVSLEDAMAYAAWTGKRLPTEQEWEAAMRTREGYLYPWGNAWKQDACNVEETGIGEPSSVDRFKAHANALGIADGLGNVIEWTLTLFGGKEANLRMARGASWISGKHASLLSGTALSPKEHTNLLGFRCVAF